MWPCTAPSPPCGSCLKNPPADHRPVLHLHHLIILNPCSTWNIENPAGSWPMVMRPKALEQIMISLATVPYRTPGWRHAWQEVQPWQNQMNPRKGSVEDWTA